MAFTLRYPVEISVMVICFTDAGRWLLSLFPGELSISQQKRGPSFTQPGRLSRTLDSAAAAWVRPRLPWLHSKQSKRPSPCGRLLPKLARKASSAEEVGGLVRGGVSSHGRWNAGVDVTSPPFFCFSSQKPPWIVLIHLLEPWHLLALKDSSQPPFRLIWWTLPRRSRFFICSMNR